MGCRVKATRRKKVYMQTDRCKRKPDFEACKETGRRRWKENGIAIKRTNRQRKLEQRTVRMLSATEEQEGWRTPDHSWFEMEAADDGEIFFVNLILASYEVESDEEEDDESWIDRPWSETKWFKMEAADEGGYSS